MKNHWTEIEKYLEDQKIAQELIGELRDFPFFAIGYTKSDNISVYSIIKLSILQLTILTSLQFLPVHFLQENLSEAV